MSWMRHLSVCSRLTTIHKSLELGGDCQVISGSSLISTLNILISFYLSLIISHVIWWIHSNNPYFMKSVCVIATNNHCVHTRNVIGPQVDSREISPFTPAHIHPSPRYPACDAVLLLLWHCHCHTAYNETDNISKDQQQLGSALCPALMTRPVRTC